MSVSPVMPVQICDFNFESVAFLEMCVCYLKNNVTSRNWLLDSQLWLAWLGVTLSVLSNIKWAFFNCIPTTLIRRLSKLPLRSESLLFLGTLSNKFLTIHSFVVIACKHFYRNFTHAARNKKLHYIVLVRLPIIYLLYPFTVRHNHLTFR